MFESIIKSNNTPIEVMLIIIGVAILLGLLLSLTYMFIKRKQVLSKDFPITLIILPLIVSIIIVLVGDNTARAFSLAGIFALTRFRSEQKDTQDIAFIFLTVALGLATGLGFIAYAVIIDLVAIALLLVLHFIKYAEVKEEEMNLKIVIPENLSYEELFDDIFEKYTTNQKLLKVKTTDFGTMYELQYVIKMKKGVSSKEFIDQLRTRNGNMNIALTKRLYNS